MLKINKNNGDTSDEDFISFRLLKYKVHCKRKKQEDEEIGKTDHKTTIYKQQQPRSKVRMELAMKIIRLFLFTKIIN